MNSARRPESTGTSCTSNNSAPTETPDATRGGEWSRSPISRWDRTCPPPWAAPTPDAPTGPRAIEEWTGTDWTIIGVVESLAAAQALLYPPPPVQEKPAKWDRPAMGGGEVGTESRPRRRNGIGKRHSVQAQGGVIANWPSRAVPSRGSVWDSGAEEGTVCRQTTCRWASGCGASSA
ncbi:DUF6087 family protein [Streptomyces anulatus]